METRGSSWVLGTRKGGFGASFGKGAACGLPGWGFGGCPKP